MSVAELKDGSISHETNRLVTHILCRSQIKQSYNSLAFCILHELN
jgi:hypothetical protein